MENEKGSTNKLLQQKHRLEQIPGATVYVAGFGRHLNVEIAGDDLLALITSAEIRGGVRELESLKIDSNGYGGDTVYCNKPFIVVPIYDIEDRIKELKEQL